MIKQQYLGGEKQVRAQNACCACCPRAAHAHAAARGGRCACKCNPLYVPPAMWESECAWGVGLSGNLISPHFSVKPLGGFAVVDLQVRLYGCPALATFPSLS